MNSIQNNEIITETPTSGEMIQNPEFYNLDACFMLDATGSMQSTIDMARDKIKQIIAELRAQYVDAKVRIAIVAYRDNQDEKRFEIFPFDESVDAAYNFLGSIEANGGGDTPEDVNGGFRNALDLKWGEFHTKMLYHMADAPCHGGKRFHDSPDHYPNGLKDDEKWETIFKKLYDQDINYMYFDIEGSTKKMFNEFKKIYMFCGEEKANLVFTYEQLYLEGDVKMSRYGGIRGLAYKGMKDDDESYKLECYSVPSDSLYPSKSAKAESSAKFAGSTVKTATIQRMKNVEYRSAKKA